MGDHPRHVKSMQEVAVSQGLKTRSVNRRAPLNLLGGYRFPKSIEIEAALAVEGCLLVGEPGVELPDRGVATADHVRSVRYSAFPKPQMQAARGGRL